MPGIALPGVPTAPGSPSVGVAAPAGPVGPTGAPSFPNAPPLTPAGKPGTGNAKQWSASTIAAKQKILRQNGFNVTVDGQDGPQTITAWKAFHQGISSHSWNAAWTAHHSGVMAAAATGTPAAVTNSGGGVPAPAGPTPPTGGTPPPPGYDPTATPLIDPQQYAAATANAQYNPQINALVRQIADAKAQQGATQKDIQDWYSKLVGDTGAEATQNNADAQAILGGHDAAAAGLVNALGGSASAGAAEAGAQAGIGRSALEKLGLSNTTLSRNLGTAYAGEGVTALRDQNRQYATDLKTALGQKADLLGAKGAAETSALQSAYAQRTAQQSQQLDDQIKSNLAGVQLDTAKTNLEGTKLNTQIARWRLQAGIKAAAATGTPGAVQDWGKLGTSNLSSLSTNMQSGLLGPKGNLAISPVEAYNRIGNRLRELSYGKWDPQANPQINQWRNQVIIDHLPEWNRTHPNEQYGFFNGKIKRTK